MIDLNLILATIYFLAPAYFANMTPVIIMRLGLWPDLNRPIDGGHSLCGQRLLGSGKTWRGLISGFLAALIICGIQSYLQWSGWLESWTMIDYQKNSFFIVAILSAIGALGGDVIKSFFKRRFKINSGQPWPIFDQVDFILGYLLIISLINPISAWLIWLSLIITLILHPITNIAGYWLKIKKVWW